MDFAPVVAFAVPFWIGFAAGWVFEVKVWPKLKVKFLKAKAKVEEKF